MTQTTNIIMFCRELSEYPAIDAKTTLAKNTRRSDRKPSFLTIFHGGCFPEDHLIGIAGFFSTLPFFISRWVQAMIYAVSQHVLAGVGFIQGIQGTKLEGNYSSDPSFTHPNV